MRSRAILVGGLLVGAVGIAILWAAGVDFPVAIPPGLVILLTGAAVVAGVRRRWSDGVGALLGLFVIVGFVLSGINADGFDNLLGENGAAVAIGQVVQLVGVVTAAVSGALLAFRGD
ncbi:hypothetical protein [Nocardioides marmotae]|uniref:Uncharacterized protein n=1 Tax=Nocardioides marmotae TaxID=2663857 RepID=A0A6I3JDY1_9ACTN|nr:hypothetical protein [Nocardioides marmotae]MCR6032766.1 hypothetical protein [Gordonia jinghuaiqii]MBC9735257.1 hypothetical protein [Nocardioides marmotae]MTB86357.1 hypothetical protein [Nocardioides marmotae]MTB96416.1 hypothetical protein [Nocardioides marmotae]QKE02057.1 hypothetical protein HPC71_13950 [Nocardioides marmotae]